MEIARRDVPTVECISDKLTTAERSITRLTALCHAVLNAAIDLPGSSPAVAHVQALAELTRDTADAASASFSELLTACETRIAVLYSKPRVV